MTNAPNAELVAGLLIVVLSAGFLIWANTSPDAGYLMIIGGVLMVVAYVGVVVGASLVAGGLWDMSGRPERWGGRAIGLVAGIPIAHLFWNWKRRPRR